MKTKFLLSIFLLALSFQAMSKEDLLDKSLSVKAEQESSYEKAFKTIPQDQYFAGGAASFVLGFGIGHAIQGRWKERGWIFTAAEIALVLAVTYFFDQAMKKNSFLRDATPSVFLVPSSDVLSNQVITTHTDIPSLLSLLAFAGISVWEKIDIFLLPSHYKIVKRSSFQIKPLAFYDKHFHYGLSLNYQF
ncbi:MAG: hypothetical protein OXN83_03930 [Oligoflexia bacterium]|nr:hypothetical protein [Oligoflexia bacterium]